MLVIGKKFFNILLIIFTYICIHPWWLRRECRRPGSIPGSGRAAGEGNDKPFQYSYLENSMGRGARWATVHGVAKSRT